MKRILFLFGLLIFFLTACSPASNPETVATEVPVFAPPDYNALWDPNIRYYCTDTWVTDPKYAGFEPSMEKISETRDGMYVTQTWRVYLEYIEINDHRIYVDNWHVVKVFMDSDGDEKYAQELEPEKWVIRAKELAPLAQDFTVNYHAEWNGKNWDSNAECSK